MAKKNQQRLFFIGGTLVLILLATLLFGMGKNPPVAKDESYHEGPWVNKKGDLVDTRTGKILQKDYIKLPPSNRIKVE